MEEPKEEAGEPVDPYGIDDDLDAAELPAGLGADSMAVSPDGPS